MTHVTAVAATLAHIIQSGRSRARKVLDETAKVAVKGGMAASSQRVNRSN